MSRSPSRWRTRKARGGKAPIRARGGAAGHPRHADRGRAAGGRAAQFPAGAGARRAAIGRAWADISTGLFETRRPMRRAWPRVLGRLDPAEILAPSEVRFRRLAARRVGTARLAMPSPVDAAAARRSWPRNSAPPAWMPSAVSTDAEAMAAAQVLAYIAATQMGAMPRLSRPVPAGASGQLSMDAATRASLEILTAPRRWRRRAACSPPSNARSARPGRGCSAAWIAAPLNQLETLAGPPGRLACLARCQPGRARARGTLRGAPDVSRALGRIALGPRRPARPRRHRRRPRHRRARWPLLLPAGAQAAR